MTSREECCSVETSGKLTKTWGATHCSLSRGGLLEAACQMLGKCSGGQILHGLSIWNFCVGFFLLPHFVPLLGQRKALFISLQAMNSLLCRSLSH